MRLLKKEIGTVNAGVLNTRYCELLEKGETLPANEISIAEAREILWIEDELRGRLIKFVGHDFYPPDRVEEKKPQGNTIKEILAPTEPKPGAKIKFKVTVTSSIGTKVATFTVEANTKAEAGILIEKEIRGLGLKRATWKLS